MPKKLPDDVSYHHYRDMFRVAFTGIKTAFKEEKNMRFDVLMCLVVSAAGMFFRLRKTEWCFLLLGFGIVLMAEMMNTAIENIVDFICPHYDCRAGKIKDLASGAVLILCFFVALMGLVIFVPYLLEVIR